MTTLFSQAIDHIYNHVDELTEQVVQFGIERGYLPAASGSLLAWKKSIIGVSEGLCQLFLAVEQQKNINTSICAEMSQQQVEAVEYLVIQAGLHQQRGIELYMFLGLLKYYRRAYKQQINALNLTAFDEAQLVTIIDDYFDLGEVAVAQEYNDNTVDSRSTTHGLRVANQVLVQQKNQLISILENIPFPALCIDKNGYVRQANSHAYQLFPSIVKQQIGDFSWLNVMDEGFFHISGLIDDFESAYQLYKNNRVYYHRTCIGATHFESYLSKYNSDVINDNVNDTVLILRDISEIMTYEQALEEEKQQRLVAQQEIISMLGEIIECRSGETGLHVQRVSEVAGYLAELYGLNKVEVDIIKTVTPLHDVGKVAIPDEILNKPGRLTSEEFEVVQTHSAIGYRTLQGKQNKSNLIDIASIIAHEHHEKWDGTGYPCGKSGESIHLYARIVAIADVFDALLSKRPYKDPWSTRKVLKLFQDESGKHFDPELANLFIEHFEEFVHLHSYIEENSKADDFTTTVQQAM